MAFDKKRFMEGAGDSSQKLTLKNQGSRGASGNMGVSGKMNIFAVLDRGIRRDAAKTTNKGTSSGATNKMLNFLEPKSVKNGKTK